MKDKILKVGDTVSFFQEKSNLASAGVISKIFSRNSNCSAISVSIYTAFDVQVKDGTWVVGYKVTKLLERKKLWASS